MGKPVCLCTQPQLKPPAVQPPLHVLVKKLHDQRHQIQTLSKCADARRNMIKRLLKRKTTLHEALIKQQCKQEDGVKQEMPQESSDVGVEQPALRPAVDVKEERDDDGSGLEQPAPCSAVGVVQECGDDLEQTAVEVEQEHGDETTSMAMELDQLGAYGHMLQDHDNQKLYDDFTPHFF